MDPDFRITKREQSFVNNNDKSDEALFESIFKEYFPPLVAYCKYRFGFDSEKSKDIVQGVFLRIWENKISFSLSNISKAYLYKSAYNSCLDVLKHHDVEIRRERYIQQHDTEGFFDNNFLQIDFKKLNEEINEAISEMPEQMKKIFVLCKLEGLTYTQAAAQLGISVKTVETQMSRAFVKLRNKLSNYPLGCIVILYFISK